MEELLVAVILACLMVGVELVDHFQSQFYSGILGLMENYLIQSLEELVVAVIPSSLVEGMELINFSVSWLIVEKFSVVVEINPGVIIDFLNEDFSAAVLFSSIAWLIVEIASGVVELGLGE